VRLQTNRVGRDRGPLSLRSCSTRGGWTLPTNPVLRPVSLGRRTVAASPVPLIGLRGFSGWVPPAPCLTLPLRLTLRLRLVFAGAKPTTTSACLLLSLRLISISPFGRDPDNGGGLKPSFLLRPALAYGRLNVPAHMLAPLAGPIAHLDLSSVDLANRSLSFDRPLRGAITARRTGLSFEVPRDCRGEVRRKERKIFFLLLPLTRLLVQPIKWLRNG
jgi:hypothetical protein